jgi:alpha-ribazole phosphatase
MIPKESWKEKVIPGREQRTRLFLVRHGQVENHAEFRFNGHTDVDVSEFGRRQLEAVADLLKDEQIDEIYSSDLRRTVAGARAIALGRDLEPSPIPGLREMNFGVMEGLSFSEITDTLPDVFNSWRKNIAEYPIPDGESFRQTEARVLKALHSVIDGKQTKNILVVAHGGPNRIILSEALNLDLSQAFRIEQDYACVNVIDYYSEWSVVKLVNGTIL